MLRLATLAILALAAIQAIQGMSQQEEPERMIPRVPMIIYNRMDLEVVFPENRTSPRGLALARESLQVYARMRASDHTQIIDKLGIEFLKGAGQVNAYINLEPKVINQTNQKIICFQIPTTYAGSEFVFTAHCKGFKHATSQKVIVPTKRYARENFPGLEFSSDDEKDNMVIHETFDSKQTRIYKMDHAYTLILSAKKPLSGDGNFAEGEKVVFELFHLRHPLSRIIYSGFVLTMTIENGKSDEIIFSNDLFKFKNHNLRTVPFTEWTVPKKCLPYGKATFTVKYLATNAHTSHTMNLESSVYIKFEYVPSPFMPPCASNAEQPKESPKPKENSTTGQGRYPFLYDTKDPRTIAAPDAYATQ